MKRCVDTHRDAHGVEPICKVLPIDPSMVYRHAARVADPERRSARAKCDEALSGQIRRVWDDNVQVYGVRKVWRALHRDGEQTARCTVERLMHRMGLRGVIRGKGVKTTVAAKDADCPLDHVKRQFPISLWSECLNRLWVSDCTDVSTWQGFVIDAYAHRIVGCWRRSATCRQSRPKPVTIGKPSRPPWRPDLDSTAHDMLVAVQIGACRRRLN